MKLERTLIKLTLINNEVHVGQIIRQRESEDYILFKGLTKSDLTGTDLQQELSLTEEIKIGKRFIKEKESANPEADVYVTKLETIRPKAYVTERPGGQKKYYSTAGRAGSSSHAATPPEPLYTKDQMIEFAKSFNK